MTLILASQSKARQDMLHAAGLDFEISSADLDENAIMIAARQDGKNPDEIAELLATEKARSVSAQTPGTLVIGSDQVLECEGQMLSKAANQNEAREKLKSLRGKTHCLISAVSVVQNEKILWKTVQSAELTMHDFDDNFLQQYMECAGEALTRSVGAYELESLGAQLFDKIEGDYFTILGMPLLPLLKYLRENQGIGL
ncbi:MAG TPA: Maf family nucleotide pyrophosphatase [Alphaproteobacteria bacterium]|nr:septum formation protein Maf [Alphaproteobacteria bacterium]USO05178.1 MAG: septum formation protein Maf [Rhodospirillales bacterium]HOO82098.1 Maf family nucleotide pyrophosphatase [Alphaproteobacteria bacterium]